MVNPVMGLFKVVVIGDSGPREFNMKTALLSTYTAGKWENDSYVPTSFENYCATVKVDNRAYSMGLFDTAGGKNLRNLRALSYPQTDVFIVVAMVGFDDTFESIENEWAWDIRHHCPGVPFIVVGIRFPPSSRAALQDWGSCPRSAQSLSPDFGEGFAARVGAIKYLECQIDTPSSVDDVFREAFMAALGPSRLKRERQRRSWKPKFLPTIEETAAAAEGPEITILKS
ncbi:hypothetical protein VTK56DRAFT_2605 [Thermocarpiscus australiensis]